MGPTGLESLLEHFILNTNLGGGPPNPRQERLQPINIHTIKFRTPHLQILYTPMYSSAKQLHTKIPNTVITVALRASGGRTFFRISNFTPPPLRGFPEATIKVYTPPPPPPLSDPPLVIYRHYFFAFTLMGP